MPISTGAGGATFEEDYCRQCSWAVLLGIWPQWAKHDHAEMERPGIVYAKMHGNDDQEYVSKVKGVHCHEQVGAHG